MPSLPPRLPVLLGLSWLLLIAAPLPPLRAQDLPLPSAEEPFDVRATRAQMRDLSREERAAYRAELRDRLDSLPPETRAQVEAFLETGGRGPLLQLFDGLPPAERAAALEKMQTLQGPERRAFLVETFGADAVRQAMLAEASGAMSLPPGASSAMSHPPGGTQTLPGQDMPQPDRPRAGGRLGQMLQSLSEEERAQLQAMPREERRAFLRERFASQGGAGGLGGGPQGGVIGQMLQSLTPEERASLRDMSREERRLFIRERLQQQGLQGGGAFGGSRFSPGAGVPSGVAQTGPQAPGRTAPGGTDEGANRGMRDPTQRREQLQARWAQMNDQQRAHLAQRLRQRIDSRLATVPEAQRAQARARIAERLPPDIGAAVLGE